MLLMHNLQYDINETVSDWFQNVKISIVGFIPTISKLIPRFNLRLGLVVRINKRLVKSYIYFQGLKDVLIQPNSIEIFTTADHRAVKKTLIRYRRLVANLEKAQFFHNPDTEDVCWKIIDTLYAIERHARHTAYSEASTSSDKELIDFSTKVSSLSVTTLN